MRFNSSIINYKDGYIMAFRTGWQGSDIYLVRLDRKFKQIGEPVGLWLTTQASAYGREDPRLFYYKGKLHVAFVGVVGTQYFIRTNVLYARISDDLKVEIVYHPQIKGRNFWEKNHSYFEHDGTLYAIYTIKPHRIMRINGMNAEWAYETHMPMPWAPGTEPRGGASPVRVGDEYWHFFHSRTTTGGILTYCTGLYAFEAKPPFRPTRMIREPIEWADRATVPPGQYAAVTFCCGAVRHDENTWVLSCGIHDRWTELHSFSHQTLEEDLMEIPPPGSGAWIKNKQEVEPELKGPPPPYSIVIPFFKTEEKLHKTVKAILGGPTPPAELMIIDQNDALPASWDISWLPRTGTLVRKIIPDRNIGVAAAWNVGRKRAAHNNLIVLNDDVVVAQETLVKLISLPAEFDIGLVRDAETNYDGGFCCFLLRKSAETKIGLFDPEFWPAYYEDTDYSVRINRADIKVAVVRGKLDHQKEAANLPWVDTFARWNRARFCLKWGASEEPDSSLAPTYTEPWNGKPRDEVDLYFDEALMRRRLWDTTSDIVDHLPRLKALATNCSVIVEFGRRNGCSTIALLAGSSKSTLISYDIEPREAQDCRIEELARHRPGVSVSLRQGDSLTVPAVACDLLFIDTKHTFDQLMLELDRHGPMAKKIVLHDTATFGERGEDQSLPGLQSAIDKFCAKHNYHVSAFHRECHGLSILEHN
jgi:predicted GH43/DUF377 family glycosyl hydrolase